MQHRFVFALLLVLCLAPAVHAEAPEDWHNDVVYQIFPRSFADGNGDGIGDLRGITQKVDYLKNLGVNVVWINPIYKSTHYDSGYDVTDYTGIDPDFGTLEDFAELREALHKRGMKLMMDIVLNHSSDEHPWFIQERRVKSLQFALSNLLEKASSEDGEQVMDLLADPASIDTAPTNVVQAARSLVKEFTSGDDHAAVEAGYPTEPESLQMLARQLAPCVEEHTACHVISQPFDDFYIWRDHTNNWTSIFSGSVWHRIPEVGGYYLALFSSHQIDLNWRNPRLRKAMEHIVRVWEDRGVDGLRLDSIGTLSKDTTYPEAPPKELGSTGRGLQFYTHRESVHSYMRELATAYTPNFRTVGEVAFTREHPNAPFDYAGENHAEMNEVFVFEHMGIDCKGNKWRTQPFVALPFKQAMDSEQSLVARKAWLGNYFENHDQMRIVSRYGDAEHYRNESGKLFATLLMTLGGSPFIYQGQELGMTNLPPSFFNKVSDVDDLEARSYYEAQVKEGEAPEKVFHEIATRCRDHVRSAMQWSGAPQAGFSSKAGPVRVNPNYTQINAEQEQRDPQSVLRAYQDLIKMRQSHPQWVRGDFTDLLPEHPTVFVYQRKGEHGTSWVLLNISSAEQHITLPRAPDATCVLGDCKGHETLQTNMTLHPWDALIFDIK